MVPAYMSINDFAKLLSAAGVTRPSTTAVTATTPSAVTFSYATQFRAGDTVFLSTANWTNATALSDTAKPFGNKGFVIFHKAGDGAILLSGQATNTNLTGNGTNAAL